MDEIKTEEPQKKRRGWPKGKPRRPAGPSGIAATASKPPDVEAPIHVLVRLRGQEPQTFGCSRRTVENGFHVFFYPSKRDPYRETRREICISEVLEIEITEARQVYDFRQPSPSPRILPVEEEVVSVPSPVRGPIIHSARKNIMNALETSQGPIKMDEIPGLSFGDSVK